MLLFCKEVVSSTSPFRLRRLKWERRSLKLFLERRVLARAFTARYIPGALTVMTTLCFRQIARSAVWFLASSLKKRLFFFFFSWLYGDKKKALGRLTNRGLCRPPERKPLQVRLAHNLVQLPRAHRRDDDADPAGAEEACNAHLASERQPQVPEQLHWKGHDCWQLRKNGWISIG